MKCLLAAATFTLLACNAFAAAYPEKPVRLVLPYGPGGGSDVVARPLAHYMSERTGAQFSEAEPTLADLASRLAGTVGNLATRLREGSIDDLVDDTRALARRNPGLFIAGGFVAGFVLARFVKASARRAPTLTDEIDT